MPPAAGVVVGVGFGLEKSKMIYYDFVREISFFCIGVTASPNSETGNNFSSPKSVRWRQFGKKTSSSRIFGGGGGGGAAPDPISVCLPNFPPHLPGSGSRVRRGKNFFSFLVLGKKVSVFLAFIGHLAVCVRGYLVWVFGFKSRFCV